MSVVIKTRIKTKIGIVSSSGLHMTTETNKGADLHKMASQIHDLAGGGKLYRQETVDELKSKIAELEIGIKSAIATAESDCPEDVGFELASLIGQV